jgi:hypothetical protein
MGYYDLPSFYKTILEHSDYAVNGQINPDQKITYFGHSEGTSQMFVGLSDPLNKEFMRQHTGHFFALSPIAFLSQSTDEIAIFVSKLEIALTDIVDILHVYELGSLNCDLVHPDWDAVSSHSCSKYNFLCDRIELDINRIGRSTLDNIELSRSGASFKQYTHYSQLFDGCTINEKSGQPCFQKFDYTGFGGNQKYYGQDTPPQWDLSDWDTPTTLIVGLEDPWGTLANTAQILKAMGNPSSDLVYQQNFAGWGHQTVINPDDPTALFSLIAQVMGFTY